MSEPLTIFACVCAVLCVVFAWLSYKDYDWLPFHKKQDWEY